MLKKKFAGKNKYFFLKRVVRFIATFFFLIVFSFFLYNIYFLDKIFPGISLAGIDLGGKTPKEALGILKEETSLPGQITLVNQNQSFEIKLKDIDASYDLTESVMSAFNFDRSGNVAFDFYQRLMALARKENRGLVVRYDKEKLKKTLSVIAGEIATDPIEPSVKLVKGEIVVNKGKAGQEVDTNLLEIRIGKSLSYLDNSAIDIPEKVIDPTLTEQEAKVLSKRAENLIGKSLSIDFEYQNFSYSGNSLFALLGAKGGHNETAIQKEADSIAKQVERNPQNPVFVFVEGRVAEFAPAKDGIKIKSEDFKKGIANSLAGLEEGENKTISLEIPIERTASEVKTADVNNLGIKELIGRGVSHFRGSIPGRIYNINLAASRINGSLIKPGDVFSFNNALGDVSVFTGYQQAYIIKDGKTILGDGGGVCQVSSTLFRAALAAGLPIVERRAHAYRVGYYEQDSRPGFDATVYSPTTDLKIKNDTGNYILIQAIADTKNATLVFELYGTKDGRVATTTKPKITDQVAPPDDLYQDDPTLPAGSVKQIDYKAWGAKVSFNYKVERDGETVYQKNFVSNYRPWQAIYLRGTGPVQ